MSKDRNKVYVDPGFMPQAPYKKELKLVPFVSGIIMMIVYLIFSIVMIKQNDAYFKTYNDSMNFFRMLSWVMSGKAGFYLIGCWLISIVNVVLFVFSGQSESSIIYYLSKVFLLLSVVCFIIPIVAIVIIL